MKIIKDYKDGLFENLYNKRLQILNKIPLLKEWSTNQMNILCREWQIVKYYKNQYIIKEGDVADKIYFIIEGEIEVKLMKSY